MTRLQEKVLTCECRKTKRKQSDLVTTSKVYQTRSGLLRRRGKFFKGKKRRCLNSYDSITKFQGNGFYHKMETSIILQVPPKERTFTLNDVIPSTKCVGNDVAEANTCVLIENTLDNLLSSEVKKNNVHTKFLKSNTNFKEVSPRSNNFVSNKLFPHFDVEKTNGDFQNGVFKTVQKKLNIQKLNENFDDSEKRIAEGIIKFGLFQSDAPDFKIEGILPNYETDKKQVKLRSSLAEVKKYTKRKSQFELYIHSLEKPGILTSKRKKKGKKISDLKKKQSYEKELIEAVDLEDCKNLDNIGVYKKKRGRKPKQKGPFLHYLDIYVKNKDKYVNDDYICDVTYDDKASIANAECNINYNQLLEPSSQLPIENIELHKQDKLEHLKKENCCDILNTNKNLTNLSNVTTSPVDDNGNKLLIKKKRGRPKLLKKEILDNKCSLHIDKTVDSILGYRYGKKSTEVLVLFRNGTSNWIEQDDLSKDFLLKKFFQNKNQNFSVMNRLPYQIHATGKNRIENLVEINDIYELDVEEPVYKKQFSNLDLKGTPNDLQFDTIHSESTENILVKIGSNANVSSFDIDQDKQAISTTPHVTNIWSDEVLTMSSPSKTVEDIDHTPNKAITIAELNDLCKYVISSSHIKLYPYELNRPIISKCDGDFMHIYLKHVPVKLPVVLQELSDGLDLQSCTVLINLLEDCEVSDKCQVVVIGGIDEFFAHTHIFEKLLKNSASSELKSYQEDVSMLRYLIQTIRNFSKPIVAVIKKPVAGLPASLLSLFDMVFDEQCECVEQAEKNSKNLNLLNQAHDLKKVASNECKNFVFPRVIGLTQNNEAQIMGNRPRQTITDFNVFDISMFSCMNLSNQLRTSVQHMCNNGMVDLKTEVHQQEPVDSETITNDLMTPIALHSEQKETEDLEDLKFRLNLEKEKYLADLRMYLDSIKFS